MSVSTAQYIDLLFKKLQGVAKTATSTQKSASNESIASPALLRGDIIWTQADQIPSTAQVVANVTLGYLTTSRIECVADNTVPTIGGIYPTWKTNLTYWIPQEFGSTWPVKVWVDTASAANPTATGTQIFATGIGGVGEFFFDTQAGVLNFIGETIPSTLTAGKSIFVTGYRYVGQLGVTNLPSANIGNIQITGNTIATLNTNGDLVFDPNGTGQVIVSSNLAVSNNLSVLGNAVIDGDLTVNGNVTYLNVNTLDIEDPIIELGRGPNNAPLTTNDSKDRGTRLWYYSTSEQSAFVGFDNSQQKLIAATNVSITNEIVTVQDYGTIDVGNVAAVGNISANYVIGNGTVLTSVMTDRGYDQNNYDTLTQMGVYTVNRVSWGGVTGAPTDSMVTVGLLEVKTSTNSTTVQSFFPGTITEDVKIQFDRTLWAGVWTPWVRLTSNGQQIEGGSY